jgi:predicted Zn-dependent protease
MKRAVGFVVALGLGIAGIYYGQHREKATTVSANGLVAMMADAQRDITRAPMRVTRLSDDEEIAIGNQLAQEYVRDPGTLTPEEQALEGYVQRVGGTVASRAHRRLPYSFHLVPDRNVINAFSLPGGAVYVGEGLTTLMTSEDQLAVVLGHEVEHIDHYHCAERVQIEARLRHLQLDIVGALLQIPLAVWEAGYNKDEEMEADREGIRLAVLGGYSPYGAVSLFERFGKLQKEEEIHAKTPEDELGELAMQSLEGYFRSHPQPSERLAQANALIVREGWQGRKAQRAFRVEFVVRNGELVR